MAVQVSTLCPTDPVHEQHTLEKARPSPLGSTVKPGSWCRRCRIIFEEGEEYVSCSGNCGSCCIVCDKPPAEDEDSEQEGIAGAGPERHQGVGVW